MHPATAAMVEDYVAWYDRHDDPAWKDTAAPPAGRPRPSTISCRARRTISGAWECFSATTFLSAEATSPDTPAYGHLIALGIRMRSSIAQPSPEQRPMPRRHRARDRAHRPLPHFRRGRGPDRLPAARGPADRVALKIVEHSDARASWCAARSACTPARPSPGRLYRRGQRRGARRPARRPSSCRSTLGVTVDLPQALGARSQPVRRAAQPAASTRLDGQMWLDDVVIPWNRVFLTDCLARADRPLAVLAPARCWLSKAEFTSAWRSPAPTRWGSPSTRRPSTTCST